jgi:hypothetical protein
MRQGQPHGNGITHKENSMEAQIPQIGDYVETPRFLKCQVSAVLYAEDAERLGFTESAHLNGKPYRILGRMIGINRMDFAVVVNRQN